MKIHEKYIKRCIELAENGFPMAAPNPSVGAVLVYQDRIIGEGYTSPYGGPHAEVNAINGVKEQQLISEATLYVSLEPCSHFGKTPPCSDLIIQKRIKKVVIGCVDPFVEVAGRGIEKLKKAGVDVIVGVLEKECINVNRRFFTFHMKKRPYIILKWAQSSDGYIGKNDLDKTVEKAAPIWITNHYSRQLTHKLRASEKSIMVGINTLINDNPKLNTRDWHGNNPLPVVLDPNLKAPENSDVLINSPKTIIIADHNSKGRNEKNVLTIDFSECVAQQVCSILYKKEIQSIIIEGGQKTLQTFIDENLWDETWVFKGANQLHNGVKAPVFEGKQIKQKTILNDQLILFENK